MNDDTATNSAPGASTKVEVPVDERILAANGNVIELSKAFHAGQQHGYEQGARDTFSVMGMGGIAVLLVGAMCYYMWPAAKNAAK